MGSNGKPPKGSSEAPARTGPAPCVVRRPRVVEIMETLIAYWRGNCRAGHTHAMKYGAMGNDRCLVLLLNKYAADALGVPRDRALSLEARSLADKLAGKNAALVLDHAAIAEIFRLALNEIERLSKTDA